MGYDYALVHLLYTVPSSLLLTFLTYPLFSRLDLAKVLFLVVVAVVATIPWDSHLIRTGIWTYPPDAVLGISAFSIPAEELFFFVIQTYLTSQLYVLVNKPVLHAQYLNSRATVPAWVPVAKLAGQLLFVGSTLLGLWLVSRGGEGTYLGLILAWACPFALLTWSLTAHFILALPLASTLVPIALPTIYLWVVDELALGRGTWAIESGTKLGVCLFGSLEIEEAIFFLLTNTMIVLGLAAFDKAVAVVDAFPHQFEEPSDALAMSLIRARFTSPQYYDMERIAGIRQACARLQKKSRSFHLASSAFPGRLRIDMTLLYSYCRLADDLVDDAPDAASASEWIAKLHRHLALRYQDNKSAAPMDASMSVQYAKEHFPPSARSALNYLPAHLLPKQPLDELLEGFEMDLAFDGGPSKSVVAASSSHPIRNENDLELYASRVASTVGQLCLELVFHHCCSGGDGDVLTEGQREDLRAAACRMGLALQYVNIARDVLVDARINRVYLPTSWLRDEGLTPETVLASPRSEAVERVRNRMLKVAFGHYDGSRRAMRKIPKVARGPMIVAVESYMEIGRVLLQQSTRISSSTKVAGRNVANVKGGRGADGSGRATVPKLRRIWVAWSTLMRS